MKINLSKISTRAPKGLDKVKIKRKTTKLSLEIGQLCQLMYAEKKHSLLIIFQGMDASGKDGATKNVFKHTSPNFVSSFSFKKPSELEFSHDFLWRAHKIAPPKGKTHVFIRSHYEDILIQRVHKWIDDKQVTNRINAINALEKLLQRDNNTTILKFYLHLSKKKQQEKLLERTQVPEKYFKHNDTDWNERKHWDEYRKCYEDAISRSEIPWIIAPVDQRWYRNYFITKKVRDTLLSFDMKYPNLESKMFKQA